MKSQSIKICISSKGVSKVYNHVKKMPYIKRRIHIQAIKEDLKSYIYQRFELEPLQRVQLMSQTPEYFKFLGEFIGLMLSSGLDVDFDIDKENNLEKAAKKKKCKTSVKVGVDYDGDKFKGKVGIGFTF